MANRIPENTNVEAKLFKFLYMKDLGIGLSVLVIVYFLSLLNIIPAQYTGYAYLFALVYGVILVVRPFATNPKRRNYRALAITMKKDRNTYEEIPQQWVDKYKEDKKHGNVQTKRTYKDVINEQRKNEERANQ